MNGVEIEIDPLSLTKTDDIIKNLDPEIVEKLAEGYAIRIGPGHPPVAKLVMVRSHVQNEWFLAKEGAIPDMVQKNHKQREEVSEAPAAAAKTAAGEAGPRKERAKAVPQRYTLGELTTEKQADLAKIRGQRKFVVESLQRLGGKATPQEIADDIVKTAGAYPSKHEDVAGSCNYHLSQLKAAGFVTSEPAEQTA